MVLIITKMKELKMGDLTAKVPIIQGGMGVNISLSRLSAAVANEGGIGVIATASIGMEEPDFYSNFLEANIRALRREIQKAKSMTKGILGVNIMVAMSNFGDLVRTSIEEKIDVIFSGAGLPLDLPEYLTEGCKTKLVPIVSSGRAARLIAKVWKEKYDYLPDAFVVEGPKAGGHLGFKEEQLNDPKYAIENLVTEVLTETRLIEANFNKKIPVIAAGGIFTGKDIYDIMQLGASGVQMGTRFVATDECDASDLFKQAFVDAKEDDVEIIKSPVGMPGRAIKNQFTEDVKVGMKKPFSCPYHCISTCDYQKTPYCICLALMNAQRGSLQKGFAFAGANVAKVKEIVSVKALFETLKREYAEAAMEGA
jgi:nitronate monooxygenase